MTFFRIKKIKGKEYAYVVENYWRKKGSRQKVIGYLGRTYKFELKNNVEFLEHYNIEDLQSYIEMNKKNKIIKDLVEWELFKFGINKEGFHVDFDNTKILKNKKNVVLAINEGYLCSLSFKNLIAFKIENDEQQDGYRFARAFVEAGIKVPQDIFVALFGKLYKAQ